jgi:hypothetical protein
MLILCKPSSRNITIQTKLEFINFISGIILNLKPEYLPDSLFSFYEENKNKTFVGLKKFKKTIKNFFFNKTILNKEYWESRGWNSEESSLFIENEQKERSKKSLEKMNLLKEEDYSKWKSIRNTNIEYYLKLGYSLSESEMIRKERQSTFSKKKCIEKYGIENGLSKWEERQKKWITSLSKINSFDKEKDSCSMKFFQEKFGEKWKDEYINRNFHINRNLIKIAVENSNSIDTFVYELHRNKNIYSYKEILPIINSVFIQTIYSSTKEEIRKSIYSTYGIIPSVFGNIRWFNGHICRSNGEYYIAKKLSELKIEYVYEKKYPNGRFICDFYIPKHKLYVEYMGFLKSEYMRNTNKKICDDYISKYTIKEKVLMDSNSNFIFDTNPKKIIEKIINYDNKK